jgi:hypothetical protein
MTDGAEPDKCHDLNETSEPKLIKLITCPREKGKEKGKVTGKATGKSEENFTDKLWYLPEVDADNIY